MRLLSVLIALICLPGLAMSQEPEAEHLALLRSLGDNPVVTRASVVRDGGSLVLYIAGADGAKVNVKLDGSMATKSKTGKYGFISLWGHPSLGSGATTLAMGGAAEKELAAILQRWLATLPADRPDDPKVVEARKYSKVATMVADALSARQKK